MRFKRPQVRYSDTPEPVTPYQAAAQVWDLVQGHEPVLGLHGPNPACPVGRSIQHSLTDLDARARQAVRAELDRVTVADLAAGVVV